MSFAWGSASRFPWRASGDDHRGRGHADAVTDRLHVGADVLHRVVDRKAGVHLPARGVDVEADIRVRILGCEEEELSDHEVRDLLVDRPAQEHDAVAEQARVDVEGALGAAVSLDDGRDQRHCSLLRCIVQPTGCTTIRNSEVAHGDNA